MRCIVHRFLHYAQQKYKKYYTIYTSPHIYTVSCAPPLLSWLKYLNQYRTFISMPQNTSHIKKLFTQNQSLFIALGDPYRQQLLLILSDYPRTSVQELTTFIALSRPAISHHLRILREAGLLQEVRVGTKRYYQPTLKPAARSIKQLAVAIEEH